MVQDVPHDVVGVSGGEAVQHLRRDRRDAMTGCDLVFGVEVVEEAASADAGGFADLVDGDLVESALEDEPGSAVLDTQPGLPAFALAESAIAGLQSRGGVCIMVCISHPVFLHPVKSCTQCNDIYLTPLWGVVSSLV